MNKRVPILLGFLFIAFAIWLQVTSAASIRLVLERLESIVYDMGLRAQVLTHPRKLSNSPIAIVDVDDASLNKEGRWPWPRAKLGELVDDLQALGAVVIALDMIFPQEEQNIVATVLTEINKQHLDFPRLELTLKKIYPFFNEDAKFSMSMDDGDMVVGMSFTGDPGIRGMVPSPIITLITPPEKALGFIQMDGIDGANPAIAKAAKHQGFINVFPDGDGIIRRVPLLLRYQDKLYPSLALEAVRVYLLGTVKLATAAYGDSLRVEGVQLNDYTIPTDSKGQVLIPFIGRSFSYPYFSAADVLNKKLPPGILAGKIVFVGTSATGLGDLKATAIQSPYPGVEVHATIAEGILEKHFPFRPAWAAGTEIFLIVACGMVLTFLCPFLGPRILAVFIVMMPFLFIFSTNYLREKTGLLIAFFIPMTLSMGIVLLNLIYGYLFESRRREHLKQMFGQYVPEKHIDKMLKSGTNYALTGEDREMTVLFADIRNFTSISEHMTAAQLKDYLNAYLNPMTKIIFKYQGTIDKYVGDLIMAFWGAPLHDTHHASHAINAALEMQTEVTALNKRLAEQNTAAVHIGIGLNSGMMSVGDMGSQFRLNYTVLGDAVNLASRVEGLTKHYGVNIIAAENTVHQQPDFLFCLLDRVRVKGKHQGVAIYEVVCRTKDADAVIKEEMSKHEMALNFYFQQKWAEAEAIFHELYITYPRKKLYTLYLDRITEFKKTPPPPDWDGIFTLLTK